MNIEELKEAINNLTIVECRNTEERNRLLEFLLEIGFDMGPTTSQYLGPKHANDAEYLHPGKSSGYSFVSCYRRVPADRHSIPYHTISGLIDGYMNTPLDERTAEEFGRDFVSLMG